MQVLSSTTVLRTSVTHENQTLSTPVHFSYSQPMKWPSRAFVCQSYTFFSWVWYQLGSLVMLHQLLNRRAFFGALSGLAAISPRLLLQSTKLPCYRRVVLAFFYLIRICSLSEPISMPLLHFNAFPVQLMLLELDPSSAYYHIC